jgi:hypothetical protein
LFSSTDRFVGNNDEAIHRVLVRPASLKGGKGRDEVTRRQERGEQTEVYLSRSFVVQHVCVWNKAFRLISFDEQTKNPCYHN